MAPYSPAIGESMNEYDERGLRLRRYVLLWGAVRDIMELESVSQCQEVMREAGPFLREAPESISS